MRPFKVQGQKRTSTEPLSQGDDHSFSSSIDLLSDSRMSALPVVNCSSSDTATVDDDAHSRHLSNFPMLIKCSASV